MEDARVRAAASAFGPEAVIVLGAAAHLHGWPLLPPEDEVHVSMPGQLRRRHRRGLRARQLVIDEADVVVANGVRVTSPARTAADVALAFPKITAVPVLDAALNAGRLDDGDIADADVLTFGRRGAVVARRSLAMSDGRAASPLESRVRVICVDGGIPPEALQFPVYDPVGNLLAVADLAWPSRGVLAEADGRTAHDVAPALLHDRRRQNELIVAGYRVLRFTWEDTMHPAYIVGAVKRALTEFPDRRDQGRRVP